MACGKKSVKATTKRGKVTRVPSRAKAKSAVKTFLNHNTEPYREAYDKLEGRTDKIKLELERDKKSVEHYESLIESSKRNIQRLKRMCNNCDEYDCRYVELYLDEIKRYKENIQHYKKRIEELRTAIDKNKGIINANKTMMNSLEPVIRYHRYHARRDFDRISKASYIRVSRWNEHYDGKPMRRK